MTEEGTSLEPDSLLGPIGLGPRRVIGNNVLAPVSQNQSAKANVTEGAQVPNNALDVLGFGKPSPDKSASTTSKNPKSKPADIHADEKKPNGLARLFAHIGMRRDRKDKAPDTPRILTYIPIHIKDDPEQAREQAQHYLFPKGLIAYEDSIFGSLTDKVSSEGASAFTESTTEQGEDIAEAIALKKVRIQDSITRTENAAHYLTCLKAAINEEGNTANPKSTRCYSPSPQLIGVLAEAVVSGSFTNSKRQNVHSALIAVLSSIIKNDASHHYQIAGELIQHMNPNPKEYLTSVAYERALLKCSLAYEAFGELLRLKNFMPRKYKSLSSMSEKLLSADKNQLEFQDAATRVLLKNDPTYKTKYPENEVDQLIKFACACISQDAVASPNPDVRSMAYACLVPLEERHRDLVAPHMDDLFRGALKETDVIDNTALYRKSSWTRAWDLLRKHYGDEKLKSKLQLIISDTTGISNEPTIFDALVPKDRQRGVQNRLGKMGLIIPKDPDKIDNNGTAFTHLPRGETRLHHDTKKPSP